MPRRSSFRDAPPELGFTRVRHYHCPSRQQPTWMRRPGIQHHAPLLDSGFARKSSRPGMTGEGTVRLQDCFRNTVAAQIAKVLLATRSEPGPLIEPMLCRDLSRSDPAVRCQFREICPGPKGQRPHLANGLRVRLTSRWTQLQRSGARQAQRTGSDEMPLTMVEQVRRGGAASSTFSSRGSRVFSSARISSRARCDPMQ